MARLNVSAKSKRLVWRISDRAPQGEWVDPATLSELAKEGLPEVTSGRWVRSSFDLLNGVDVDESPNTVPADLFDELFGSPPKPGPGPKV